MDTKPKTVQQLAAETEINPRELNVPHKPHHFVSKKAALFIAVLGILSLTSIGSLLYLQTKTSPTHIEQSPPVQKTTPTPIETKSTLKIYEGDGFSFTYPSDILSLQVVTPNGYGVEPLPASSSVGFPPPEKYLSGKFFQDCDLYLTVEKDARRALIALDMTPRGDGGFCWSYGYFYDYQSRTVALNGKDQQVQVSKWAFPYGEYGSDQYWRGDYFQQVTVGTTPDGTNITLGLLNQGSNKEVSEKIFDDLVNSFSLSTSSASSSFPVSPQDDGVVCTMDAKICPDGSSVGRTGPNCEFAACPAQ